MSALPAESPRRSPRRAEHPNIEIVPSRDQRLARPRLVAAIATVAGLFVILAAQLLLTIATSEGAYEIAALQSQQSELARDEQVLREGIQVLHAPQHLAAEAQGLGMVPNSGVAQLRLSDAAVLGTPQAAKASSALMTAADGTPLIPNSLLAGVPLISTAEKADAAEKTLLTGTAASADADAAAAAGAPALLNADGSITSGAPAGIPAPQTH